MDLNGSGSISKREFEDFCSRKKLLETRRDVSDLFRAYEDRVSQFLNTKKFLDDVFFMRKFDNNQGLNDNRDRRNEYNTSNEINLE